MKNLLKNFFKRGAIALSVASFTLTLAACGEREPTYYTVNFESNGGTAVASQQIEAGKTATKPDDPTKDEYNFRAWYSDEALGNEYKFDTAVTTDITLYAGWDAATYTVTFDYNYDGAEATTQTVEIGGAIERPEDPVRDDYTFMGWYTDAECTNVYDFTSEVTGDITLYAYWYELPEGYYLATFYLNDGTENEWQKVPFKAGSLYQDIIKEVEDAKLSGYHFLGWYKDKECTEEYKALNSFTENVSVYAGWQIEYTLEAEHTYLTGKPGSGYSGSTTGTGMVTSDDTDNMTASNGYYVGWMYYTGAYLSFEFEVAEDADDVTIVFRLSAQYNDLSVTGDEIYVGINLDEETNEYEQKFDFPLTIQSYGEFSSQVKDFNNYVVAENVSVKKGKNTIELVINNSIKGVGGTMKAAAPLVDCMYLYTNASITPTEYNPEFAG